jgi:hypothetical protein
MGTRRSPRCAWLGGVFRLHRLDRNPLRRGPDRAETVLPGLLIAAFAAGAPGT